MQTEGALWRRVLQGLQEFAQAVGAQQRSPVWLVRDRIMAENLRWLATQRYPERKFVVWAATLHVAHSMDEVEPLRRKFETMGQHVVDDPALRSRTIGFISAEGRFTEDRVHAMVPAVPGSVEDLLARAGFSFAFLDLHRAPGRD